MVKTEKEIEDLVMKVLEFGSGQLCLSGPELEVVLEIALKEVEDGNMDKMIAEAE